MDTTRSATTPGHGAPGSSTAQPRERGSSPSNFVGVAQVLDKVANLHGRMLALLEDLQETTTSERERLLIGSWIEAEREIAVTLAEQIETLDSPDDPPSTSAGYDVLIQYGRLDAFEQAVDALEGEDGDSADQLRRAARANELLIQALEALAERVEHSDAQDILRSLADLERASARRRSSDTIASLTL